jgi:pyrroline-5-carboxylate reductase
MKVGFIGGGNMASAIIGGLLARGFTAAQFHVVEVSPERRQELASRFAVTTAAESDARLSSCDALLLATKPQQMHAAASNLKAHLHEQLVISIAAGIRLADLGRWLGGYDKLVRAMPNTPALLHAGITGLAASAGVTPPGRELTDTLMGAVGETIWFDNESMLDAVTAVSGSGPAYVFYFIEALAQAGEELGMTRDEARKLALHTFLGAARLAADSDEAPATLRAKVTSKGGTTERAIAAMEAAALKSHFIAAVKAAADRSRELGEEFGKN